MLPENTPKRPRTQLVDVGRRSHVSQTALRCVFDEVLAGGLPDAFSQSTQRRHRHKVAMQVTDFGPLLQEVIVPSKSGDNVSIWIQHPLAWLQAATNRSSNFRHVVSTVLNACGNNVNICLYNDEVDPGKELAARHGKKVEAVYWTLLEFGFPALNHEEFWFTLMVLRTEVRATIDGGMSHVIKAVLNHVFRTHDVRDGVMLQLSGEAEPRLLFGKISAMVQDERAVKGITLAKGAAGTQLCVLCQNIFDHKRRVAETGMLPSTSLDVGKFILHTDASVRATLNCLQDSRSP